MKVGRKIFKRLVRGYRIRAIQGRYPQPQLQQFPQQMQEEQQTTQQLPRQTAMQPAPIPATFAAPEQLQIIPTPFAMQARMQSPMEVKGALELIPQKKEYKFEGIEIPEISSKVQPGKLRTTAEVPRMSLTYSLIPRKPAKGEAIFAYAKIYWDNAVNRYFYQVSEPQLTDELRNLMIKIKDLLEQKLDIDFSRLKLTEASAYLSKQIDELISYYKFKISATEREILRYYVERDFMGFGKIEALMKDPQIEDISCDGVGIPIFIYHRNPDLGSVMTNVVFEDADELDSFINKLSQIVGKSVSVSQPLVEGSLPDGSRLQATLATDIARRGSNFTIRKFSEEPITPIDLLNYNTVDVKTLAYLWMAVDFGRSILVCGGTASGKTSLLNALSLFIRPEKKIVSIEDTPELKMPHPHWIPTVARTAISVEGGATEVDMFRLLRESLRQRPDYIVVGEVRGQEAYILFQQMATGHPSYATIHAENLPKLVDRLTTAPISLPPNLVSSLDLIVFLLRVRYRDKFVRRVNEVLEMMDFDADTKKPIVNKIFTWSPLTDRITTANKSLLMKKISDATGISEQEILEELKRRMVLLNWMKGRNITDYKDMYKILAAYYSSPTKLLSTIMGE